MDPPKWITPTELALKNVHFDHVVLDRSREAPVSRVCSDLTARLAGRSMNGRSISEAPNVQWTRSILGQLQAVRSTQNLVYRVDRELVDGQPNNIHRLVIPLSFDGRLIDEYIVASQAVSAQ
jgi:hypothetical protein